MKGMIFDGESVRQILAGNKTQSRRIVKPQPTWVGEPFNLWIHEQGATVTPNDPYLAKFARYKAGETVYVKEAYNWLAGYKADHDDTTGIKWQTPLFMPESLSRIKLQIVRVGMERVKGISYIDIKKEGIAEHTHSLLWNAWQLRWIEVNSQASWDSNPWVWVYEFVRV